VKLPESGPPVEAPIALGLAIAVDALVALALLVGTPFASAAGWFRGSAWAPWAAAAYGLLVVAVDLVVARMKPTAMTWRRRLGFLALVAIAWRPGPFGSLPTLLTLAIIFWVGLTWIALVIAGRELSRAIATATGEDKPE
jgi:hypothetical protein